MAAAQGQVPDDSDDELGPPHLPNAPGVSSQHMPGNPFPLSPVASPSADPARGILEQLAATTQLLSNIVWNQQAQPAPSTATSSLPGSGFSDANKILSKPDPFGSTFHESDLSSFQDWVQTFKNWITFADGEYENLLSTVEKHLDSPIDISRESDEFRQRGTKLYPVLSSLLKHKPRTILKQVEDGFEVWRQLHGIYAPKTRAQSLAVLNALTSAPAFSKEKTLQEQVFGLERISHEYTRISGRSVGDDVLLGTLLRCLPQHIRNHIQLVMTEQSTYHQVRAYVLACETTTTSWSPQRVHQALGVTAPPQNPNDNGPVPMEIDRVKGKGKEKGKGKGKDGSPKGKGKGQGKGKGGDKGKAKGKGNNPKGKGKGHGQSTADANVCLYCQKPGHWKRDCHKYKRDLAAGKVQAIADDSASQVSTVAPSHSASNIGAPASSSTAPQPKARVARVVDVTVIDETPELEIQYLRMVSCNTEFHAIADADDDDEMGDDAWSILSEYGKLGLPFPLSALDVLAQDHASAPSLEDECVHDCVQPCTASPSAHLDIPNSVHHFSSAPQGQVSLAGSECVVVESSSAIRALSHIPAEDIILDSGADVSALPASYANGGVADGSPSERYVDASGRPLKTCGMRIAEVQVGPFRFKERFLVGGVTCPLLSLGKMYKAGFYVVPGGEDGQFLLTNGIDTEPVKLKRHSLCAVGHVRVIDTSPQVRAIENVTLNEPLRHLDASGWQCVGPSCYALLSFGNAHVDTTLIPLSELLWYRTTLIRVDDQWILDEFAEDISGMADRAVPFEHSVEQVITIAHNDPTLSPQDLSFATPVYATSPMHAGAAQVPSGQEGAAQVPSGQEGASHVPSHQEAAAHVPSGQEGPQADVDMQVPVVSIVRPLRTSR